MPNRTKSRRTVVRIAGIAGVLVLAVGAVAVGVTACGGSSSGADVVTFGEEAGADGSGNDDGAAQTPVDGGGGTDGGTSDGGNNNDGGRPRPGGDASTLRCGSMACSIPDQTCCIGAGPSFTATCVTGSTCPVGSGAALKCSGAANCVSPNKCCITATDASATSASSCKAACDVVGEKQMCNPEGSGETCPAGSGGCSNVGGGGAGGGLGLPGSYGVCQ